ncbi:MAG: type II secretion system F family protein, partial [Terrimicrobiaceae bacterium]|nr:type II secretion system F family protein [Terrimicrobiaceae bacterium]
AGAGPLRGLEAAGKACRNARLAAAALRAAEEGRRGEPLATAFHSIPPAEIARALELGQTSGRLDAEMEMAARALEAAAGARLEAIAEWLPRVLYLGILAYVGWQIVATAVETGRAVGEALDPGL